MLSLFYSPRRREQQLQDPGRSANATRQDPEPEGAGPFTRGRPLVGSSVAQKLI